MKLRVGSAALSSALSAKRTSELSDRCHSAVRQYLTPEDGFRTQIVAGILHTSQ